MLKLIFALGLVLCVSCEDSLKSKILEAMEPRLLATAIKIQKSEDKLDLLKEKLKAADKHDLYDTYHELLSITEHFEGNGCEGWNFQCGGHSRQCVSHLHVCDGHSDCDNDADEDEDTCSLEPVKAGRIFDGHVQWISCLVHEDHPITVVLTNVYRYKSFSARAAVIAKVSIDAGSEKKFHEARGYYNLGTRTMVLFPQHETCKNQMFVCTFNMGDDDHASCVLQSKASQHHCATTVLAARDEDD